MKPRIKLATAATPDGSEMVLHQHDGDFSITINGQSLMQSRQHESELELARLGCAHLAEHPAPQVLIGGLGMGYTLRQALDLLQPKAKIQVSELMEAIVHWNREYFGTLNNQPMNDDRAHIMSGSVVQHLAQAKNQFDSILLDVDNGPSAMTDSGNRRLYGDEGIHACREALRERGCLAVWSAGPCKRYEERLMRAGLKVRRFRAQAYAGSKAKSRFIFVASEDPKKLPAGGGEPLRTPRRSKRHNQRPKRRPY